MRGRTEAATPRRLQVFLCYASENKSVVEDLHQRLKACNVDSWFSQENLVGGQLWELEIRREVKRSDVIVVCLSQQSVMKRGFVQKEIKLALDVYDEQPEGSIFLIPLRLDDCVIPESLQRFHAIDYFKDDGYSKLIGALKKKADTFNGEVETVDCQRRVSEFVKEFQELTRTAVSAAELRSSFVTAAFTKLAMRLKLGSRQDVRRNRIIIAFRNKGAFRGNKGSSEFQEAKKWLIEIAIPARARNDGLEETEYIGVCFDGIHWAFVFKATQEKDYVTDVEPFNERSGEALVLALERDSRIELTPQNVVDDFGPDSKIARVLFGALWRHLDSSLAADVPRVKMLYDVWVDFSNREQDSEP